MKKLTILTIALFIVCTFGQVKANSVVSNSNKGTKIEILVEKNNDRSTIKKPESSEVSQDSKNSFYMIFGNVANIDWTRGEYYDQAAYTVHGANLQAYFDDNGQLIGTTSEKKFSDLSNSLQKSIKKYYPQCTVGQIIKFKASDDNTTEMMLNDDQFQNNTHYFIELTKVADKFIVMGDRNGDVSFYKQL